MTVQSVIRSLRNAHNFLVLNANKYWGSEFVPDQLHSLYVAASSVCNLKGRFCASLKKRSSKVMMSNEFFIDCIERAVAIPARGEIKAAGAMFADVINAS